jgi:hypothetical protein
MILIRIFATLNAKGIQFKIIEDEVTEGKVVYNDKGRKRRIPKDSLLKPNGTFSNNLSVPEIEYHGYCLPENIKMLKDILAEAIRKKLERLCKNATEIKTGYDKWEKEEKRKKRQ